LRDGGRREAMKERQNISHADHDDERELMAQQAIWHGE